MAVEYIDNPAFNAQIISSNPQTTLVSGYHAAHNLNIPGFHIYFGGDALSLYLKAKPSAILPGATSIQRPTAATILPLNLGLLLLRFRMRSGTCLAWVM